MMHELYGQEKNIDALFVGSSHCYRSLDTSVTDEIMRMNTFNAGSSAQCLDGSYQMIREAAKHNDLKHVYVELYYVLQARAYEHRKDLTSTYILSDYMKPSLSKFKYLLDSSDKDYWFNSFVPARRYWRRLGGVRYMSSLLQKKSTSDYKKYKYTMLNDEEEAYQGKGFVANYTETKTGSFHVYKQFGEITDNTISKDARTYIHKICNFCKKKGIELTFFSSPISGFRLAGVGNYDKYINDMKEIVEKEGVQYYDFNLCKSSILKLTDEDFKDTDHLNVHGAFKYSEVFSKFFTGKYTQDDLFYSSVEEKLSSEPGTVFGMVLEKHVDEDEVLIRPVTNLKSDRDMKRITYTIVRRPYGEDAVIDQKFGINNTIRYSSGERGKAHVICYLDRKKKCDIFISYGKKKTDS
jgi:hypothetical protein